MDRRREPMTSQRKKTAPPTPRRPRSSSSSRKGLIATEKTKKQSAKKRTALDNRFHRTLRLSRRGPPRAGLTLVRFAPEPANERGRVGLSRKFGGGPTLPGVVVSARRSCGTRPRAAAPPPLSLGRFAEKGVESSRSARSCGWKLAKTAPKASM